MLGAAVLQMSCFQTFEFQVKLVYATTELCELMAWVSAEGQRSWVRSTKSDKLSPGLRKWEMKCMGDSVSTLQMCVSFQIFLVCVVLCFRFFWQEKSEKVTIIQLLGLGLLKEMSPDITYGKIQWLQTGVTERTPLWKSIKYKAFP